MSTSGHTDKLLEQKQVNTGDELAKLMKILESIDEDAVLAELNETTIGDNNAGRIEL
jgi:hypothetical protein